MKIIIALSILIILGLAYYFTRDVYKVGPITLTISMSQEDADFLIKSKNKMKVALTIKSRHDDSIYSLFNLLNHESLHTVLGGKFTIVLPEVTTARKVGSFFAPYWIRLDIYNSSIDTGDVSRLTCFQNGQNKKFAVLDQELLSTDLSSGEIFKNSKIDVECSVNKESI